MSEGVDEETRAAMIRQLEGEAAARKAKDERTPTSEARQKRESGSPPREAKLRYDLEVEKGLTKLWKTRAEECSEEKARLEDRLRADADEAKQEVADLGATLTAVQEAKEMAEAVFDLAVEYLDDESGRATKLADDSLRLAEESTARADGLAKELADRPTVEVVKEVPGPEKTVERYTYSEYVDVRRSVILGGSIGLALGLFAYYVLPLAVAFIQRLA